ncbi:MAG: RsbRD N-terminal domain-containing protein [Ignavibacteria bacterium]|jgi:hypothetical protein
MLYERFTSLVEQHAEELTRKWIQEVKTNSSTPSYRRLSENELDRRVYSVYKKLGNWLLQIDHSSRETAEHFIAVGKERARENFKFSEIIYAIFLERVVLWDYIQSVGLINNTIELQQALEFYHKITGFFDKAAFFAAIGYESELGKSHAEVKKEDFLDKSVSSITRWLIKDVSIHDMK